MVRDLSPEAQRKQPEPQLVAGKKRYREESPVEVLSGALSLQLFVTDHIIGLTFAWTHAHQEPGC